MTVFDFYRDLLRGKGSCYHAVKEDPIAYHNVLMHAAIESTAFDQQCEGTRADYIYSLLKETGDVLPYLQAAITAHHSASPLFRASIPEPEDDEEPRFYHNPNPTNEDFHFLSELLALFAKNGNGRAKRALLSESNALFRYLLDCSERPDLFFPERDCFEELLITLCDHGLLDPIDAIADLGYLLKNPIFTHYDFDQFHDLIGQERRQEIKARRNQPAFQAYLAAYYPDFLANPNDIAKAKEEEALEDLIADLMPSNVSEQNRTLNHEAPYSHLAEETSNPTAFMVMVETYKDPDKVESAFLALSKMRDAKLRKWALERLESDPVHYLPIVMRNYEPEDEFELCYELKQIEVDSKDENGWHGVHLSLLHMKNYGLTAPAKALAFVYHHTYCPICRYNALRQLAEQKMLTTEMLSEALYDCYEKARDYVKKLLQ